MMNGMYIHRKRLYLKVFVCISAFIAACAAPCRSSTLNKTKQLKPAQKATEQNRKVENKEPNLVYYQTIFESKGYGKTDVKAAPSRNAETVGHIWYDGICVAAYPGEKQDGAEKWIKLYSPIDNNENWILLKRLKHSRECKEAYALARDLYKVVEERFRNALNENDKYKRYSEMDNLPIDSWIKSHISKTVWTKSTYDDRIDDFCMGGKSYCNFHYHKIDKQTMEVMKANIGEKFSYLRDINVCRGNPKQCFISLLELGVEKNNIIFFHSPGAAHNSAWYFSKRRGKWIVTGFAVITD